MGTPLVLNPVGTHPWQVPCQGGENPPPACSPPKQVPFLGVSTHPSGTHPLSNPLGTQPLPLSIHPQVPTPRRDMQPGILIPSQKGHGTRNTHPNPCGQTDTCENTGTPRYPPLEGKCNQGYLSPPRKDMGPEVPDPTHVDRQTPVKILPPRNFVLWHIVGFECPHHRACIQRMSKYHL